MGVNALYHASIREEVGMLPKHVLSIVVSLLMICISSAYAGETAKTQTFSFHLSNGTDLKMKVKDVGKGYELQQILSGKRCTSSCTVTCTDPSSGLSHSASQNCGDQDCSCTSSCADPVNPTVSCIDCNAC